MICPYQRVTNIRFSETFAYVINNDPLEHVLLKDSTPFFTLAYQNVQRKVKKSKHSRVNHSKRNSGKKALSFDVDTTITPLNYFSGLKVVSKYFFAPI